MYIKSKTTKNYVLSSVLPVLLSACSPLFFLSYPMASIANKPELSIELTGKLPKQLKENSGMALVDNTLWFINDSGNKAAVYQVQTDTQKIVHTVKIKAAKNKDWETLAHDDKHLFIGDCGNNSGKRNTLTLYKIKWQHLLKEETTAKTISFSYADKKKSDRGKNHNFDCEAITSVNDQLWLFTKNRGDQQSSLYILDKKLKQQTLKKVATFPVRGLITGADYNAKTKLLALIGYKKSELWGQSFLWTIPVKDEQLDWQKAKHYPLSPIGQWEAVSWKDDKNLYISTEKNPFIPQYLGQIKLPKEKLPEEK